MAGSWLKRNLGIGKREVIEVPVTNQNQQGNAPIATAAVNIETTNHIPGESDIDLVSSIIDQSEVRVGESEGERKMIGEGAFAKVYKGRYKDSPCAVKIFTREGQEYAKSELRLVRNLSEHGHENIVLMIGIWMDDLTKHYSLVMELCDKTLFDYLADIAQKKEISTFRIKQKLLLLRDISRAMVFLHGRSILHLDLHAANVLLLKKAQDGEERYVAKVCDFGRSVSLDTSHKVEITAFGKEEFMPPEVLANHQHITLAIDVFSYGCLILHVLTCKFPKPEKGGTSSFGNRKYLMTNIKGDNHQVFQPLIQQCLADEPAERGNFPSIDTKLAAHFKYYGMEAAENLNEKTVENEELRGQLDTMRQKAARLQEVLEKLSIAEGTIEKLQKNEVTLNQTNIELQGQLEAKNKDIENKHKELYTAYRKLEELQNKQTDAFKEVGPMFNEFQKANEENAKLKGQLAATEEKLKAADNAIAKLKGDCKEYRKEITKIQKAKDDEEKLHLHTKDQLSKKTAAYNEYVDMLRSSQSQKAAVEDEKRKLEIQVKVLEENLQTASGDLEDSRAKRKESANHLKNEKKQNHKLKEEKTGLQSQNEKLCDEITTLKGQKEELEQANNSLTEDIKKVKNDFAATQSELNQCKQVNGNLRAQIEKTSREAQENEQKIKKKEVEAKEIGDSEKKLQKLNKKQEQNISELEAEKEKTTKELENLKKNQKKLESQLKNLDSEKKRLTKAKEDLEEKLGTSKESERNLKVELDVRGKYFKEKEEEIRKLKNMLEAAKIGESKIPELTEQVAELDRAKKDLEKQIQECTDQLSDEKKCTEDLKSEVSSLNDLLKERDETIKEKEEEIENLSGGKKSIWEDLTKTITDKDNLEQSFREQESHLTTTKRKSENLEKEVERHKKDIKDLQRAHERIRKTENEGLHRKIVELQDRIQQQMVYTEHLKASLKESEYKRGQAAAEIQEKETEMGETKEQLAIRGNELTQLKEELHMVNGELSETRDVLRDRNTTLEENHEHLSESEKRIRELEKETKNLQSAVIDLKASVLRRENELAEKENKISKTTAELDTKKADCELAVAEKEALKKAITDVTKQHEEEVAQLNRQLLQAGRRIREYEEKEDDIRSNLEDVKGTKKKLNKETQELDKRRRAFYSEKRRFDAQKESRQVLTVPVAEQMDDADKVYVDRELTKKLIALEEENATLKSQCNSMKKQSIQYRNEAAGLEKKLKKAEKNSLSVQNQITCLSSSLYKSHQYSPVMVLLFFHCQTQPPPTPINVELLVTKKEAQVMPLECISSEFHCPLLDGLNCSLNDLFKELLTVSKDPISGYGVISLPFIHYGETVELYRFHFIYLPMLLSQDSQKLKGLLRSEILVVYGKCNFSPHMTTELKKVIAPSIQGAILKPTTFGVTPDLSSRCSSKLKDIPDILPPVCYWLDEQIIQALKTSFSSHSDPLKGVEVPDTDCCY